MTEQKPQTHAEGTAGQFDPGENGEDRDIQGKRQEDLTAEDLEGDTRQADVE
jgi:hypothetical protein